ncbi:MAG TPA: HhH-GPD-type base excision DNA repair protein [Acidimicrobiia bacterium]|nr:HhH-GPD-type base excision DNA repair protein [Acidimicrobiia bacterium]
MSRPEIPVTGDPDADRLLAENPFALLVGMLLDQQVPMEWAFKGPATLQARLGRLDPATVADLSPDEVDTVFRAKPAVHRFPSAMAKRTHALARVIVDDYGGDTAAIWCDAPTGADLLARLRDLPGFGDEKAKIFLALLAKRLGVRPPGWEAAAAPFSDTTPRSVADIDSPETLARVRDWKRTQKAHGKGKAD